MFFIPLTLVPYHDPSRSQSYGSYGSFGGATAYIGMPNTGGGVATSIPVSEPQVPPPAPILIAAHAITALSPYDDGTCGVVTASGSYQVTQSKDEVLGLIDAMYRSANFRPSV